MNSVNQLCQKMGVVGIHIFHFNKPDVAGSIKVRHFASSVGVDEDCGSGTSNCALACALHESGRSEAGLGETVLFSQGDNLGSPCRLTVRLPQETGEVPWVGGTYTVVKRHIAEV